jgi:hypothetical protein
MRLSVDSMQCQSLFPIVWGSEESPQVF